MTGRERADYGLSPELVVEVDGPVRWITMDRPDERNGANRAMHQSLAGVWGLLDDDDDARVAVLTGRGTAFSAGGDFDYMQENMADEAKRVQTMVEARAIIEGMVRCAKPVVAAVNGPAVGLGASLAVLSDLVLIAEDAFLADPHLRMGLVPGDGGMAWPAMIGLSRAKEYLFLGSRIPAADAVQLGLATRVVATDDLIDEAGALAHRLAELPPTALQATKRALNQYLDVQLGQAFSSAASSELESLGSDEHRAAVTAALSRSR